MIFTAFDIETTGLGRQSDDILELGYIRFDNETFEIYGYGEVWFYKPEFQVEKAAYVHHLSRGFLMQHQDKFEENLATMYSVLQGATVVGKNSYAFDIPFVENWMRRQARYLIPLQVRCSLDIQDKCGAYYQVWCRENNVTPSSAKGKLEDYMKMFGIAEQQLKNDFHKLFKSERDQAHSALFDAYMTYLAAKHAVEKGIVNIQI